MTDDNVFPFPRHSGQSVPAREDRNWVTSVELAAEAGITYRQVDYWIRTNFLRPIDSTHPGSGGLRRYSEAEVTKARTTRELLDAGISLVTIREVIEQVLTDGHYDRAGIRITITHPQEAS